MSLRLRKQIAGETIDRKYRLLRLLGAGGFDGVFLADHVVGGQTLRQVAVNLFAPEESAANGRLVHCGIAERRARQPGRETKY